MRAPQPEPPIPGSFATPSLLAWIVNGKYVMSLPLYRIETDLKACGATISRQDMANWMMNVHARWLAKVHERMKVELLSHVRIHADETTVQVLKEPNREAKKKSRMWLFCSARCDVPVYVFEYHETRRKGVAQEFLAGWSGTLTTDGYKPYFNLGNPNIANTACLVHVRRYFAQIVKIAGGGAKAASAASVALEARRRIDAMFQGRLQVRRHGAGCQEGRPRRGAPPAHGGLRGDGRGPASPSLAEAGAAPCAAVRRGVLALRHERARRRAPGALEQRRRAGPANLRRRGRKNWLFSDAPRGARASAAIYSVTTTAKANGLNPRLYVEWLLTEMPNAGELTDEVVDSFLPWSDRVPESCKLDPAAAEKAKEMPDDFIINIDPDAFDDEMANNAEEGL